MHEKYIALKMAVVRAAADIGRFKEAADVNSKGASGN